MGRRRVPLLLRTSEDLPPAIEFSHWLAVTDSPATGLDPQRKLPDLARRLEQAFEAERETWWSLARKLAEAPSASLSHTVACGSFGSDFGLMLAWDRLARVLALRPEPVLMVCDDPWLFRQIAARPGVRPGRAPKLAKTEWRLTLRGFAAKGLLGLRLVRATLATRRWRSAIPTGASVLQVYGHPASRSDGFDTYFGTLMRELPSLKRLLHTDCAPPRAAELATDGRTASLHAWGSPLFALTMPLWRWQPKRTHVTGENGWLVRRAAIRENGGGGPAMNRWQMHCQRRFLAATRPLVVCWPWENHAWERDLCRAARPLGVRSVGYQHTVIGPHQINYSARANPDPERSLPDIVVADGPAYRDELLNWGVPAARLVIGGAWRFSAVLDNRFSAVLDNRFGAVLDNRFSAVSGCRFAADAPVFVPLSAIPAIARLQVEGARRLAAGGRSVLVKEHPMYPLDFADGPGLARTDIAMPAQPALSAVVYATGTSGLEALLMGLPTFRLLAEDRLSIDVLPRAITAIPVTLEQLNDAVAAATPPPPLRFESVLTPPAMEVWKTVLIDGIQPHAILGDY